MAEMDQNMQSTMPNQPNNPGTAPSPTPDPGAVIAMVLGIIALPLAFILGFAAPYVPLVLGIFGLILAVRAGKQVRSSMATAGFVLSIIAIVVAGIQLMAWIACVGVAAQISSAASRSAWDVWNTWF